MRTWSIPAGGPLSLRLAADARLTTPSYIDDQIWEVVLAGGDPAAVAVQTTYGLRARSMRIFPSFELAGEMVTDPTHFASLPVVRCFFPNYARLDFAPFSGLEVQAEYWVPESQLLGGRFVIRNTRTADAPVRLLLHALLRPGEQPQTMGEAAFGGALALTGRSGGLAPVVFMTGGASVELVPRPALVAAFTLPPGGAKSIVWAEAGYADAKRGFEAARALTARPWEADVAALEAANACSIEIETGDPDWDAAFAFTQKAALGAFVGPTRFLPHPSFVLTRVPDRGYSPRGDGRDYDRQWDGQSAAQAYLTLPLILPCAPELAKGVLRNFVQTQAADGSIDSKPGLAGQRAGTLSAPLLATLAWHVYEHTADRAFLAELLPRLVDFVEAWFSVAHDRDQDGHPEWEHTLHAGFDDWPAFVRWQPWGQGLDVRLAETVDLAAYLFRECDSLLQAAAVLGRDDLIETLQTRRECLRESVERTWSNGQSTYHHQDRDLHAVTKANYIGRGRGAFSLRIDREFNPAARLMVRTRGAEELPHAAVISIRGRGGRGRNRTDRMTENEFQWFWGQGTAASERTYTAIERIDVAGLTDDFATEIWTAATDRQDLSLLLPLWAGIPDGDRAERIIRRTLTDPKRYWRAHGLSLCSAQDPAFASSHHDGCGGVWMLWNTMLGEALVDCGFIPQAVDLVNRLMASVLHSLKSEGAFREAYDSDGQGGIGERDHLAGLAPLSLFLHTLGVDLIQPHKLRVARRNPFPWPVAIRWLGLEVRLPPEAPIQITFPDGQTIELPGDEAQEIEQVVA